MKYIASWSIDYNSISPRLSCEAHAVPQLPLNFCQARSALEGRQGASALSIAASFALKNLPPNPLFHLPSEANLINNAVSTSSTLAPSIRHIERICNTVGNFMFTRLSCHGEYARFPGPASSRYLGAQLPSPDFTRTKGTSFNSLHMLQ
jgi:hypothetical protein